MLGGRRRDRPPRRPPAVDDPVADLDAIDEPGSNEMRQVVVGGGRGDADGPGDFGDTKTVVTKHAEEAEADGVGQRSGEDEERIGHPHSIGIERFSISGSFRHVDHVRAFGGRG